MRTIRAGLMAAAILVFAPLLCLAGGQGETGEDLGATTYGKYVDAKGNISLPEGYRATWSHLGSWVVPSEEAPGYGFHDVYTQPEAVAAFNKTGQFPDGAVLVKEIRGVQTAQLTTGEGSWAGDLAMWFIMVKDTKGRFEKTPYWGKGWGWGLFKAENPDKNAVTDFNKDCIPCHVPAKETDWVFLKGYPTLKGSQTN